MVARTAFVTGATGFVGINVVKELKDRGWHVVALRRATSNLNYLKPLGTTLVEGSITDKESLCRVMPDAPDAVFHVAANLSTDKKGDAQQARDNVEGTRNVVDVAIEKRAGENHLLGGVHASYLEVATIAAALTGGKAPSRAMPPWLVNVLARVLPALSLLTDRLANITPEVALMLNLDFSVDSSKAERELGYRQMPLREMIEDSCRWLKDEGLIP